MDLGGIMRVSVLVENSGPKDRKDLSPEFGLSLHIENNGRNILFDTGTSGIFADNAEKMEIDIGAVTVYGNGASKLYYDDVELLRGCGAGRNSDVDGDGRSVAQELLDGTNSCVADPAKVPLLPLSGMLGLVMSLLVAARFVTTRR